MSRFDKLIDKFNAIPIKLLARFLVEIDKLTLQCTQKCKRPRIAQPILKNKVKRLLLPDIKTYFKITVIKYDIGIRTDNQRTETKYRTQK